jgi:hypothetical protein
MSLSASTGLLVDQHVQLDHVGRPVFVEVVVQAGIAARAGLELVEELGQISVSGIL